MAYSVLSLLCLNIIRNVLKPLPYEDGFQSLRPMNAAFYGSYLDDCSPYAAPYGDVLYKTSGLIFYMGRCEEVPGAAPEKNWRFRLTNVRCRSRNLTQLLAAETDIQDLPLDGFERLWRDDLFMMAETQKPVAALLSLPLDFNVIQIEHLALPIFQKGKIVNVIGAFSADDASLRAVKPLKRLKLKSIQRVLRPKTLELPKTKRFEGAGAKGRKFWRAATDILEAESSRFGDYAYEVPTPAGRASIASRARSDSASWAG